VKLERQPENGEGTEVGSYFVANYPPFSVWSKEEVEHAARILALKKHIQPAVRNRANLRVRTLRQIERLSNMIETSARAVKAGT
jgi:septal ring factor EnvC (AmiA/AmiB activator)